MADVKDGKEFPKFIGTRSNSFSLGLSIDQPCEIQTSDAILTASALIIAWVYKELITFKM